jgi:hypothetical protein
MSVQAMVVTVNTWLFLKWERLSAAIKLSQAELPCQIRLIAAESRSHRQTVFVSSGVGFVRWV